MKKNVLLVNPAFLPTHGSIWREVACAYPPVGLAYAAALLEQRGVHVQIIDLKVEPLTEEQFVQRLYEFKPHLIGISATTPTINAAWRIAELIKKTLPATRIILGGVHPTVLPEESLRKGYVDVVALGESEYVLLDLCTVDDLAHVDGIAYKKDAKIVYTKKRESLKNLDDLPYPAYHLLNIKNYHPPLGNYKRLPAMLMLTSRGCPGRCTFCYSGIKEKNIRTRSAGNVLEEIRFLKERYHIREISFYDDVFTLFRDNVRKICISLIEEGLDITWTCMTRINLVDEELLRLMKKAGCHQICYGIESADESVLKNIQKDLDLKKAREVIKMTKNVGIRVRISLMFGNPGETEVTMQKTIKFALETNPDLVQFNITSAYPGTELYAWAQENDMLAEKSWIDYDMSQYTLKLPTVSEEKVREYYRRAYKEFYFRPRYLLQRLLKTRSWYDLKENVQALRGLLHVIST